MNSHLKPESSSISYPIQVGAWTQTSVLEEAVHTIPSFILLTLLLLQKKEKDAHSVNFSLSAALYVWRKGGKKNPKQSLHSMYSQRGGGLERGNWSLELGNLFVVPLCQCLAPVAIIPRCPDQTVCSYVTFANEQPNLTHKRIQRAGVKEEGSIGHATRDHKKNRMLWNQGCSFFGSDYSYHCRIHAVIWKTA